MKKVEFQGNVQDSERDQALNELNQIVNDAENELNIFSENQDLIKENLFNELHKAQVAKQNIENYFSISSEERENLNEEVLKQETNKFNKAMSRLLPALRQNLNMQAQLLADQEVKK